MYLFFIFLFICLFIYLFIYFFIYLFIYLFISCKDDRGKPVYEQSTRAT